MQLHSASRRVLVATSLAALLSACPTDSEDPASLVVSADTLAFGLVNTGLESQQTFEMTHAGGGQIELFSVNLLEGSQAIWSVTREPGDVLTSGQSITVTVGFTPNGVGAELGRIQIRSSDPAEATRFVVLTGDGGPSIADDDGDGYSAADGDCDDGNADIHPGADEICDGRDTDCDGDLPADEADADSDGFPLCADDCDDTNDQVFPDAPEICDDLDSDCDGINGDHADEDGDGFTPCQDDCDDFEPLALPGGVEVCDEVDNDCSGEPDDLDEDGDGHSPCAGGDCDDEDPLAFPVVVDAEAAPGGDGTDAAPYASIDDAVAGLDSTCRTVVLVAGSYSWSGELVGEALTVLGPAVGDAILTPPEGQRLAEISSGGELTLRRMTITGADVEGDGGALSAVSSTLTLDEVRFEANHCSGDGGAVSVFDGDLLLGATVFVGNSAGDDGGAVSVVSGAVIADGGLLMSDNSAVRGGGMVADGSIVSLVDGQISSNVASEDGGGLMIVASPEITLERLFLFGNTAGVNGGALALTNVQDPDGDVRNLRVADNVAGGGGGGVYVGGSLAGFVLANNTIVCNEADAQGGGLYVDADDASGLVAFSNLVAYSGGDSGLAVRAGVGGTYTFNTSFAATGADGNFHGDVAADVDDNDSANPLFSGFSPDDNPLNDDLTLTPESPAVDSGPEDEELEDVDGTRNDRGYTGGPAATP